MNVPNAISLFRIFLVPVFTVLYLKGQIAAAMAVLLLSGVSDVLDGAIARRFNMVTGLGKILDPMADKLLQAAMLLCAAGRFPIMWLLLALQLLRELSLGLLSLYVIKSTGHIHSARWYGKLCTAAVYALMLALLLVPDVSGSILFWGVLVCAALMLVCLAMYSADFVRILRETQKNENEKTDRA